MAYDRFSSIEYERNQITDEKQVLAALDEVKSISRPALIRHLLVHSTLTSQSFEELLGCRLTAQGLWSVLVANNCLSYTRRLDVATKTRAFAELLEVLIAKERESLEGKVKVRNG